ncbi:hypothetical protein QYE76_037627 [Lolium multiflorum]|uniref:Uncharacterized protein n=1 Tax=Lolium multiflorum TaxID=4521 RepID=A0AAD8PN98_LOLMU|nr:hypothetical protein QYE76_037627 [Lolium multiflorum]
MLLMFLAFLTCIWQDKQFQCKITIDGIQPSENRWFRHSEDCTWGMQPDGNIPKCTKEGCTNKSGIGWISPIHTLDNATPFHETPSMELVEAKGVGAATPDDAMHGSTGS